MCTGRQAWGTARVEGVPAAAHPRLGIMDAPAVEWCGLPHCQTFGSAPCSFSISAVAAAPEAELNENPVAPRGPIAAPGFSSMSSMTAISGPRIAPAAALRRENGVGECPGQMSGDPNLHQRGLRLTAGCFASVPSTRQIQRPLVAFRSAQREEEGQQSDQPATQESRNVISATASSNLRSITHG